MLRPLPPCQRLRYRSGMVWRSRPICSAAGHPVRRRVQALLAVAAVAIAAVAGLEAQRVKCARLNWALLASVDYEPPNLKKPGPRVEASFPAKVLALEGQMVEAEGFMIPLDVAPNGASMFVLNPDADVCAFGVPPRMSDWVMVTMPPGERALVSHLPTIVKGRFSVGEEVRNGRVTSIYRIHAESAAPRGHLGR